MKNYLTYIILALIPLFLYTGCSSGKETTDKNDKKNEIKTPAPPKKIRNPEIEERMLVKKLSIKSMERLSFDLENGKPVNRKKLASVKYDNNGFPTETSNYGDDGKIESIFTYTYDKEGKRTETVRSSLNGVKEKIFTYQYDPESGLKIRSDRYNLSGMLEKYYLYKYDSNGNLVEDLWYDKTGELEYKIEYDYDSSGNKIEARTYDENDDLISKYEFRYDRQGQLVEEIKFDSSGEQTGIIQYIYQYY
jgi:hypothetical protein